MTGKVVRVYLLLNFIGDHPSDTAVAFGGLECIAGVMYTRILPSFLLLLLLLLTMINDRCADRYAQTLGAPLQFDNFKQDDLFIA